MSDTPYVEAGPRPEPEFFTTQAIPTAVVEVRDVPMAEIGGVFDASYAVLGQAVMAGQIVPGGGAVAMYTRFGDDEQPDTDAELGFWLAEPLTEEYSHEGVLIRGSELPAGEVAALTHIGSYDGLSEAWSRLTEAVVAAGRQPAMPCWEVYLTQPTPDTDPATLRTDLYCLLA